MKKTVLALVVSALLLGGCGQKTVELEKSAASDKPVIEMVDGLEAVQVGNGVEVLVTTVGKVSAVEFEVVSEGSVTMISFIPNKEIFNSVLANSSSDRELGVSMGIIKAEAELPEGKLLLGKVLCRSGEGKITVKNFKLVGPGTDEKPSQLQVRDLEFATTIE